MSLPSDRTNLQAAAGNQVPNHLLASALNISAMITVYNTIDELYNFATGLISASTLSRLGVINVKDYNASGSSQSTTGSITAGSNILTNAAVLDFANGQGISIAGFKKASSLQITANSTSPTNITVTLDGVATAIPLGTAEVASLTVTAPATASSNVTVTLNGVAFTVPVLNGDTAISVATKIRAATFAGWTTGGTAGTTTVTFTSTTTGVKTDATYSAGTTGATGTMTTPTQGTDTDTINSIATKIRATSFIGWVTGGSLDTVTFTSTIAGVRADAIYSAGTTGAAGSMTTTTQGTANLVTKISAGAGTTTLTLSANATTTVTGAIVSHDDTAAIQAAIDVGATTTPKGFVTLPTGQYNVSGLLNVTCDINFSQGVINIVNGGKLFFSTGKVKVHGLNVEVKEILTYAIVNFTVSHVTANNISVIYGIDNSPAHIAINIEPISTSGLWDLNINNAYINHAGTGIQLKSTGWITGVNITNATIMSYMNYGVNFDDSPAKGIAYCSIKGSSFENIQVSSLVKTAIHLESFGNVVDDIKIYNDDALLGTHYAITAIDRDLEGFITGLNGPSLANQSMMFTANKISNVRAEGLINLGHLKNLYKLENVHVYQSNGITHYDGYDYHHDYGYDYSSFDVDLSAITVAAAVPANITVTKAEKKLTVTMNATTNFRASMNLPQYIIDAINKSGFVVAVLVSDVLTYPNAQGTYLNIRRSDLTLISGVNQSQNMRTDKKLIVKSIPLAVVVPAGAQVDVAVDGFTGETYVFNCMRVYTNLVNPINDMTPYLANI